MQAIQVTPEGIGTGIAALAAIAVTVRYVIRAELATFRTEMQTWVNGSFMRSREVEAKLEGFSERLDTLQRDGCARHADHFTE